jgi:alpha-L-arabinofuranosidase
VRKKTYSILSIVMVCVLAASAGMLCFAGGGKVRLNVRTDAPRPFHKELYGFNTNMLHGLYAYTDKNFVDMVSSLDPVVLRFPGGTVGNFYHWKKAGFDKSELDASSIKWLSRQHENLQKTRKGVLSFDDFMALCAKLNIKPLLTVNLYTGTPEESAEWVRYVKQKGYKVFGWELGNELNFPMYKDRIRDIDEYISVARRHLNAMRAVDPGVRAAVVARPIFELGKFTRREMGKGWNETLGKQTFYDAVIVHPYLRHEKVLHGSSDKDMEKVKEDIFELNGDVMDKIVDYTRMFKGRDLWLTEWNITFREENRRLADTLLHALYCGDFFVNLAKTDGITNADYHVLAGPWNGFPVYSPLNKDPENSVKRSCYYSFQIIKEAVSKSDKRYQITVENGPALSGRTQGISAVSLGKTGKVLVLVTNRTSSDVPADIVLNGKAVTGNVRYRYLAGKSLDSRGKDNQIEIREKKDKAENLVLPANSFGLIEVL